MAGLIIPSTVRCHDVEHALDTYIDGELDYADARELEAHLELCRECADKEERRRSTRQNLRRLSGQYTVTDDFRARLEAAMAEVAPVESVLSPAVSSVSDDAAPVAPADSVVVALPPHRSTGRRPWMIAVAGLAAAALVVVAAGVILQTNRVADGAQPMVAGVAALSSPIVAESVEWHVRTVPVEVTGPEATIVRDWFSDKLNFAVTVPDFGRSARLLGGRLSHVRHHEAAYLLYEADGAKLSVMMFDAQELTPSVVREDGKTFVDNSGGYNVAVRERAGVTYTFTSDMDADALADMVDRAMAR